MNSLQQQIGRLIGIEEISSMQWQLGTSLPPVLLAALVVMTLVFAVWSYHREDSSRRRPLLIGLRTIGLSILLLALLQPTLLLQHQETGASRVVAVIDRSESMSIKDAGEQTRWQVATSALDDDSTGLLQQLGSDHEIETLSIADAVAPADASIAESESPDGVSTALGTALGEVANKDATAVVLLSDMAWNSGDDPVNVASQLGRRGIGVFAVPIGKADTPDVSMISVHIRDRVFPGEEIPLKVQLLTSPGLAGETTELVASFDGREVARQSITLVEGGQMIELPLSGPQLSGSVKLTVAIEPLDREISTENNAQERTVTFLEDKVKVLYVEGAPRWEYRYLRTVLLRDQRLDVKFLMTAGDPNLAEYSEEYINEFPATGEESFDFDLVILGDVAADYFQQQQLDWMVQQVQRRGGSLIMLAGSVHAPQSYVGSPIEPLLPVKVVGREWQTVADDIVASPTIEGLDGRIAPLGEDEIKARRLWAQLAPLYDIPPVAAKPGATVLVTVGRRRVDGRPYPLVAWQRFGTGKAMFVGTELLWRLRKRVGRQYHEKFWSTSIQFMALSRLLGGNKRIAIEAGRSRYATGESVRLHADVLDAFLEPVAAESFTVQVRRSDGEQEPREISLRPAQGAEGFFQGFYLPSSPGEYEVVSLDSDQEDANIARFTVVDESLEMRRPATRPDVAQQIAMRSGGEVIAIEDLSVLRDRIEQRRPRYERERTLRLWDHPVLYLLLLAVCGGEWFLRRREQLV